MRVESGNDEDEMVVPRCCPGFARLYQLQVLMMDWLTAGFATEAALIGLHDDILGQPNSCRQHLAINLV